MLQKINIMGKNKKVRKFIDIDLELDFKIKIIASNQSIRKGKTVTERELLIKWLEDGVNKSLKELNNHI